MTFFSRFTKTKFPATDPFVSGAFQDANKEKGRKERGSNVSDIVAAIETIRLRDELLSYEAIAGELRWNTRRLRNYINSHTELMRYKGSIILYSNQFNKQKTRR